MEIKLKRGTFSDLIQIDESKLSPKALSLLTKGEEVAIAYTFARGSLIFTNMRLIIFFDRTNRRFIMPYPKVQAIGVKTFDNRNDIQITSVSFVLSCKHMVRLLFESDEKMYKLLEAIP